MQLDMIDEGSNDRARYRAGVCNIGPAEIARRRRSALVNLAVAVGLAVLLVAVDAPTWARIAVFLPLAGAIVSLEQARRRFCAGFGLAGIRNLGPLGNPERVTEDADRAADRHSAVVMVAYASAIAALVTLAFLVLPV